MENMISEFKQETLEEAAKVYAEPYRCPATNDNEYCKHDIISAFNNGAKWQQDMADKKYTEEDLMSAFNAGINNDYGNGPSFDKWLNSLNKQD
jgi:hypothetical protein